MSSERPPLAAEVGAERDRADVAASFQVAIPEPFCFSRPEEWEKWSRRFERFRIASGLTLREDDVQVSTLIYAMGDQADDILHSFALTTSRRCTSVFSLYPTQGSYSRACSRSWSEWSEIASMPRSNNQLSGVLAWLLCQSPTPTKSLNHRHPLPAVDQTLAQLAGGKVFTQLDANSSFWYRQRLHF